MFFLEFLGKLYARAEVKHTIYFEWPNVKHAGWNIPTPPPPILLLWLMTYDLWLLCFRVDTLQWLWWWSYVWAYWCWCLLHHPAKAFQSKMQVSDYNPYSGEELNSWMGFNIIAPYMDMLHINRTLHHWGRFTQWVLHLQISCQSNSYRSTLLLSTIFLSKNTKAMQLCILYESVLNGF